MNVLIHLYALRQHRAQGRSDRPATQVIDLRYKVKRDWSPNSSYVLTRRKMGRFERLSPASKWFRRMIHTSPLGPNLNTDRRLPDVTRAARMVFY
ncbi:hypothetical protein T265_02889 [Opisthorchis viverrini]|uniref:Uncharacterized protein n=1 Tax=Opisthorchis viverrini TaxID=6198 RepID=A0A074ZXR8_OPIVI|nr:hypothetical protein T265_02889 [Opisthorchis viverrini]KER30742.1 hypothetical protein T265_02889 [Opisthorchis viverrini]